MTWLVLGLLLFLGCHSVRIVADGWRDRQRERLGELRWKGLFSLVALVGFLLLLHGYGSARTDPLLLWLPPAWTRHLAALLTLPAFVLLLAAYLPGTRIRSRLGAPMVLGVALWAAAHLLANGTLADSVLFGAFLAWSIASFVAARRRRARHGQHHPVGPWWRDAAVVVGGIAAWVGFALWLHRPLIGVAPFG